MAHWYRSSLPDSSVIPPLLAALAAFLLAATLLNVTPSTAATPPVKLDFNGKDVSLDAGPLALKDTSDWLAIDDERSGLSIKLPGKWREAPDSFAHERDVIASPGWHFSRLYDCPHQFCGTNMRIVISGGVLPVRININNMTDLKDQMPRREVARVGAMIAGVEYIDPASLTPISRGKTYGYRMRARRVEGGQPPITLTVDCLYNGARFLILTIVTDSGEEPAGATALDEIAARAGIKPRGDQQSSTAN